MYGWININVRSSLSCYKYDLTNNFDNIYIDYIFVKVTCNVNAVSFLCTIFLGDLDFRQRKRRWCGIDNGSVCFFLQKRKRDFFLARSFKLLSRVGTIRRSERTLAWERNSAELPYRWRLNVATETDHPVAIFPLDRPNLNSRIKRTKTKRKIKGEERRRKEK